MRTSVSSAAEEQRALAAAEDVFNGEGGASPRAVDERGPEARGQGTAARSGAAPDRISEAMCPAAVVDAIQRSLLDRCAPVDAAAMPTGASPAPPLERTTKCSNGSITTVSASPFPMSVPRTP